MGLCAEFVHTVGGMLGTSCTAIQSSTDTFGASALRVVFRPSKATTELLWSPRKAGSLQP